MFDAQESTLCLSPLCSVHLALYTLHCALCIVNGLSCLTTLCLHLHYSVQWSLMPKKAFWANINGEILPCTYTVQCSVHSALLTGWVVWPLYVYLHLHFAVCSEVWCPLFIVHSALWTGWDVSEHFMSICCGALGIVHCVCMCVHYAVCTVYFERVELSEHFMSICTVHCASNSVHCSMLYILHFERVELSEHFMSICRGLDVSPTLLRLPPPICVLLSFSTFSSLNIEHRDSLAKRSSPSYLCATLLFYSQHFLHFLYWKNIEKNH